MDVIRIHDPENPRPARASSIAGLDLLRSGAALAVVLLHAGVPYLRHPMPGLVWPVRDGASGIVDAIFWGIEVMIMPLFLVIAGFLMWKSASRLSPGKLIRSRAKRLLIPLGFGILVVLPIDLYFWTMGLVADGLVEPIKLKSLKFDPPISDQIWGLSHLWFLLYVFLYIVVAATLLRLASVDRLRRVIGFVAQPLVTVVVLTSIAVATLVIAPQVVWGFQHAFLPVPSKWIYSGLFFAAGVALAFHDRDLRSIGAQAPRLMAVGFVLLVSAVIIGTWSLEQSERQPNNLAASVLLAIVTVGAASTVTFGLIGVSVRYIVRVPASVQYVAAASFWIYLVHHPVLGLVHTDLKWAWPTGNAVAKFGLAFSLATAISLLMYESFVRTTWLGTLLGFRHDLQGSQGRVQKDADVSAEPSGPIEDGKSDRRHAA